MWRHPQTGRCHGVLLLAALLFSASAMAGERQAVILMYHQFGMAQYPSTSVRLAQFEAHLDHLATAGYQVWPLEKVVDHLQRGVEFPARVVAITMDDAYDSIYTEAFPRLLARGWPFTVFVATDGIDKGFAAYMTWEQLRELRRHGVTLANHGASHDYLVRRRAQETELQWLARVRADIERGQRRLTEELGAAPALFAYPYGEYDLPLAELVAELGYVGLGQHSGAAGLGDDLRALPRFPMAEAYAGLDDFKTKVATLAFPVTGITPWNPRVSEARAPRLEITLAETDADLSRLQCYFSNQEPMAVQWLDDRQRRFAVQMKGELPSGRSRYTCTAPARRENRYYWYSHLWIRQ